MTENQPQGTYSKGSSDSISDNTVSIIAIIAVSVVMLACITACAVLGFAFFSNPPWF